MPIDIESLNYEELLELKHVITERLKHLDSLTPQKRIMQFTPGDEVNFSHRTQGRQTGTLLKFNDTTATVITKSGQKWNVSPHLLKKVVPPKKNPPKSSKIIDINKND